MFAKTEILNYEYIHKGDRKHSLTTYWSRVIKLTTNINLPKLNLSKCDEDFLNARYYYCSPN